MENFVNLRESKLPLVLDEHPLSKSLIMDLDSGPETRRQDLGVEGELDHSDSGVLESI